MKNIYLIRHGETDYNKSKRMQGRGIDASLNDLGKTQAKAIASFFEKTKVEQVISSSLKRAKETASYIASQSKLKVEAHAELDEMDFGILEGKPFAEVKDSLVNLHENWSSGNLDLAPEGGENPLEVFARADKKVRELLLESESEHIVFILHGRLIRILLSEWLGLGLNRMHDIKHQNGSINHISLSNDEFNAVILNFTGHLSVSQNSNIYLR